MRIQFVEGVLEYANGEYYRKNTGKPFEVDRRFAEESLLPTGFFEVADEIEEPDEGLTKSKLMAMKKEDLLAMAEGVPNVTADNNKDEIADKILAHTAEQTEEEAN